MASKRSRATFEADLRAQQSPFVLYGTPLPSLDPDVRDDGSYVPLWKQEVLDEQGRKRLHGAFTGGFSAGYFNTVGSKEGWTPSTFVSSRNKRQNDTQTATQQRPEDFMDEEDLADKLEAEKLQTSEVFAGLGSTDRDAARQGILMDILKPTGDTMGAKLLRRMGWKDGQGVGPKVYRKARTQDEGAGDKNGQGDDESAASHLFAPENSQMISFRRKHDQKGLGYRSESHLAMVESPSAALSRTADGDDDEDAIDGGSGGGLKSPGKKTKQKVVARGAIGVGILNDTGSDDEDPYEIGPRISYNRVIGGDKKNKKKQKKEIEYGRSTAHPLGGARPIFVSKKTAATIAKPGFRKCHDGRLPLEGFILATNSDSIASSVSQDGRYPPPVIPKDWKSSRQSLSTPHDSTDFQSTVDAARSSTLNPESRASVLGEARLPGKSVFDFLSPAARDRLVAASGNENLPTARGEPAPRGFSMTEEEKRKELWNLVPRLDKAVAAKALGRGIGGWMPYSEDEAKRTRYRTFLESRAGLREDLPERAPGMNKEDWVKELLEFAHAAEIFKPMTGMMASRFTTSAASPKLASDAADPVRSDKTSLLSQAPQKAEDPAEAAARMGMFGPLTRSTQQFFPTRLLCKRFNVKPPAHVQADTPKPAQAAEDQDAFPAGESRFKSGGFQTPSSMPANKTTELVSKAAMHDMLQVSLLQDPTHPPIKGQEALRGAQERSQEVHVDAERNPALEADRPGDSIFKAIFGSDDEDDDEDGDGDVA